MGLSVVIVLLLVVFVIYVSYLVINNIYNDPILKVNKKTANYISFLFEDNNDHIIEVKNPKIVNDEIGKLLFGEDIYTLDIKVDEDMDISEEVEYVVVCESLSKNIDDEYVKFYITDKNDKSLVEGNVPNGATADAIALTGATSAIIWEPNNNAHTTSGIANAANNYGISIDATSVVANYQGVNAIIPVAANVPLNSSDTTYFQTVTPTIKTGTAPTGTSTLFTINAGITKVRIYAWVEGQDVDCENDASGTDVTFNIKFTKVA